MSWIKQRRWIPGLAALLAVGVTAWAASRAGADVSSNIHDYVATKLDDFSADLHLVRYDSEAGRHINKDFGLIYGWMQKSRGDLQLCYKVPDKLRIDGRFGDRRAHV